LIEFGLKLPVTALFEVFLPSQWKALQEENPATCRRICFWVGSRGQQDAGKGIASYLPAITTKSWNRTSK
jgi:hypothetical protein